MVKLVVSDLDGTLIDSSEQLTDTAREMARWLKDRNVLFTFATGRVQGMTERMRRTCRCPYPMWRPTARRSLPRMGCFFAAKAVEAAGNHAPHGGLHGHEHHLQ